MNVKQLFKVGISVVFLGILATSSLKIYSYQADQKLKADEISMPSIQLSGETKKRVKENFVVEMEYSSLITSEIKIPIPVGLDFDESFQAESSLYQLSVDKNEIKIIPTTQKSKDKLISQNTIENANNSIETLSNPLISENVKSEQLVPLVFTGNKNGSYELIAKSEFETTSIQSNPVKIVIQGENETDSAKENTPVLQTSPELLVSEGEIEVTDWASFGAAIKDPSITKINLANDIANANSGDSAGVRTYQVTRDLEINGNGHTLAFGDSSIFLGNPTNGIGNFHMHDIVLDQVYRGAYSEDIVGSRLNAAYTGKWKYRFGNIITKPGVQRLARAQYAETTVYGNMNLDTRGENFYTGSFIMEPGTTYKGNVNYYNFSVIWYNLAARAGDTGASKEFTVGANSKVQLQQSQTSGTTYPAVYQHYQAITIGENVVYNVAMPGNAVRFDDNKSSMTVKNGAIVNLTSKQKSGAVINYNANDSIFKIEPGAYFYTIGVSSEALINLSDGNRSGNEFTLATPKQYDIRNLSDGNGAYAIGLGSGNGTANQFSILDSDIDLWNMGTDVLGPSSLTYAAVDNFQVNGKGTQQTVISSEADLQAKFKSTLYRRISGMNQPPSVEFEEITDADLTIKARVKIGEVPDNNGANSNGEITYLPVYASKEQAEAILIDTFGDAHAGLKTDENGYVSYKDTKFNLAGKEIIGSAVRGPWTSESDAKTTVKDVTPPTPAEIPTQIGPSSDSIKGVKGEVGAIVTYTVNGSPAMKNGEEIRTAVAEDGTWELEIPDTALAAGDIVQFFLTDKAGNKNPVNDTEFHDAVFKKGTTQVVMDKFEPPVVYGDEAESNLEDDIVEFRVELKVPFRDENTGFPEMFTLTNNFPSTALKLNNKAPTKITNENGVDVSKKFSSVMSEGKLVTEITNPKTAGSEVYGHTLTIKYQFVEKSGVDLMPYLKDGFYRFNLDADFQTSKNVSPLKSNIGEGTLPGPVGVATAYYRDENGKEIPGVSAITKTGKVDFEKFEFTQLDIDNYEFVKSEGPLSGLFKIDPIETIFTYKENKLTLIQSVERLDGGIGTEATIGEVLQYGLNVKTSFAAETPEVFYKAFTLTEPLDSQLEAPTEMLLKTKAGSSVGSVVYDSDNHRLVATLDENDQVPRSEELQLEYKAKVKNDTQIGTEIKAKATVEGSYSNGSQAKSQESNEVTTTITDGILEFISAPNKLSFGDDLKLAPTNKLYPLKDFDSALTVKDNRVSGEWSMVARVLKPMTGQSGRVLNGSLRYYKGSIDNEMTEESLSVYTTHSQASEVLVSDSWKERIEGPMLNVRAGQATEETYSGTIEWELQDVPGNDKFLGDL